MKTKFDINTWNRKEHFEFFSKFDEPYFGVVTNFDCTNAYKFCKENGISFFLYYIHKSLKTAQTIPEFCMRIENGEVFQYDVIHASPTIERDDHTFGFSFFEFSENFDDFAKSAKVEIEIVKNSTGLCLNEKTGRIDAIHFSTIPWFSFTEMTHARSFAYKDSVPKISFGKFKRENDRLIMPIAINCHHGLMDGYHIGKFLDEFNKQMNEH